MATYKTVQGDMWDSIAYSQLGSTSHTPALMALNAECLKYYTFPSGITLRLPTVDENDALAVPPWKQVSG